jgi:hypothetical protein
MKPVARDENIGTTFKITLYNEQLYSLIVGSKVALFLPLEKKHSQLNLLCQLYSLGKANSTLFDTYLFHINFFRIFHRFKSGNSICEKLSTYVSSPYCWL